MRSVWRSVFIWLLVLAMPVQGVAALGMQHCAPTHERLVSLASSVQAPHAHANMSAPMSAHLDAPVEALPAAANAAPLLATAHGEHAEHAEHAVPAVDVKCSACAACCPALGLPVVAPELPDMPGAPGLAQLRLPLVPSFVPGGLDRPPRNFLA